ncbi:MAG: hypothetical protein RQ722_00785 [Desulfuromonadales bacterium]|nr:hypothetical protein [Desulfuromonadales bacterium]
MSKTMICISRHIKGVLKQFHNLLTAFFACCAISMVLPFEIMAAGALAGSEITNQAILSYRTGGLNQELSTSTSFRVDELVDLNLDVLDINPRIVLAGDTNVPIAYRLTNVGNGTESVRLTSDNAITGDDFSPIASSPFSIYLDDGDATFDIDLDAPYEPGINDPTLASDQSIVIFVFNDIPTGLTEADTGINELRAEAVTGSGTAWTDLGPNSGDNNSTAILGASGGQANASASYLVTTASLTLNKSATISDPDGGNSPVPGAVITYSIVASVTGTGTLDNIVVTDVIPNNTTYELNSLRLNNVSLSDESGDDAGDVGQTSIDTVTVSLGSMDENTTNQTIEFQVTID